MSEVALYSDTVPQVVSRLARSYCRVREIFIDNLLVRVRLIIEMILVDRPFAMEV